MNKWRGLNEILEENSYSVENERVKQTDLNRILATAGRSDETLWRTC
jgi:hypothetical protein